MAELQPANLSELFVYFSSTFLNLPGPVIKALDPSRLAPKFSRRVLRSKANSLLGETSQQIDLGRQIVKKTMFEKPPKSKETLCKSNVKRQLNPVYAHTCSYLYYDCLFLFVIGVPPLSVLITLELS